MPRSFSDIQKLIDEPKQLFWDELRLRAKALERQAAYVTGISLNLLFPDGNVVTLGSDIATHLSEIEQYISDYEAEIAKDTSKYGNNESIKLSKKTVKKVTIPIKRLQQQVLELAKEAYNPVCQGDHVYRKCHERLAKFIEQVQPDIITTGGYPLDKQGSYTIGNFNLPIHLEIQENRYSGNGEVDTLPYLCYKISDEQGGNRSIRYPAQYYWNKVTGDLVFIPYNMYNARNAIKEVYIEFRELVNKGLLLNTHEDWECVDLVKPEPVKIKVGNEVFDVRREFSEPSKFYSGNPKLKGKIPNLVSFLALISNQDYDEYARYPNYEIEDVKVLTEGARQTRRIVIWPGAKRFNRRLERR